MYFVDIIEINERYLSGVFSKFVLNFFFLPKMPLITWIFKNISCPVYSNFWLFYVACRFGGMFFFFWGGGKIFIRICLTIQQKALFDFQDALRKVTSTAIREARIQEIRTELLHSTKLKVRKIMDVVGSKLTYPKDRLGVKKPIPITFTSL